MKNYTRQEQEKILNACDILDEHALYIDDEASANIVFNIYVSEFNDDIEKISRSFKCETIDDFKKLSIEIKHMYFCNAYSVFADQYFNNKEEFEQAYTNYLREDKDAVINFYENDYISLCDVICIDNEIYHLSTFINYNKNILTQDEIDTLNERMNCNDFEELKEDFKDLEFFRRFCSAYSSEEEDATDLVVECFDLVRSNITKTRLQEIYEAQSQILAQQKQIIDNIIQASSNNTTEQKRSKI